ncbi:MAG TPA: hypothetical protein VFN10_03830 [Thermoanaerobaculia bacterium]|nr:hypothetical protein [Thermoanaerobaculia bacterium]
MAQHVKIVAILSIVFGVLLAVIGLVVFGVIAGSGAASGDHQAFLITGTIGSIVGGIFVLMSLPALIGGIGLLKFRPWARILTIVVGILSLLNFPFGTAYGVYVLYVLFNAETLPLFGEQPASSALPTQTI